MEFEPVLRFAVTSDVHCKEDSDTERVRFEKGMKMALDYASSQSYKKLDAVYVVGDFANHGEEGEMVLFKEILDRTLPEETQKVLTMASHEYMNGGEEPAHEKFARIFRQPPDIHNFINGFHFISITTERGCRILDEKQEWLKAEIKLAAADDPHKPIFVFQHPHLSGTVYGSINWGEDDIISILMDYPQVIDFSGHSHAPVNDPRSIHQKHFTSFGTGSFSYFELDEFDKENTVPPAAEKCAQFLIVEVDSDCRVKVIPVDVISGKFFNEGALIEKPWEPDSFSYTDKRYNEAVRPVFPEKAEITLCYENSCLRLDFPQASAGDERVDSYIITVRSEKDRHIICRKSLFSYYYLYDMPEVMTCFIPQKLEEGGYNTEIVAQGFWNNYSEKLCAYLYVNEEDD